MDSCGVLLYRLYFPGFRDSHFIQSEIIIVFTNPSQAKLLLHFCVKTVLQLSDLPHICVLVSYITNNLPDFGLKMERQLEILDQESSLVPCFPEQSKILFLHSCHIVQLILKTILGRAFLHSFCERWHLIFRSRKRFSIAALKDHQRCLWPTGSSLSESGLETSWTSGISISQKHR